MGRLTHRGRGALGSFIVIVLALLLAGAQAGAVPVHTIASISTLGSQGFQYSGSNWAVYVPSNHSADATVPVTFTASDGTDLISLGHGALFASGQSQNMTPGTGSSLIVCPWNATDYTSPGCSTSYGLSVYKTTTGDAGVVALTTSPVAISYVSTTPDYSIRVPGATTSLDVSVQPDDTQATATIGGSPGLSRSVGLNDVGQVTDIPVVVTSQNGAGHSTYTIHVSRGNSDASLSNLTISPGTLTPDFSSSTLSYTDTVASSVSTVAVTPTNSQNGTSVVSVGGDTVADASAIPLSGTNPTQIVITSSAEDPNSTPAEQYEIDVTRLSSETLTVSPAGTGHGTVTSTAPDSAIDCTTSGAGCSTQYDEGTPVTLHEEPATGSLFSGWSGDCSGSGADTTFDMPSADATCTATFTALGAKQTKSPFTVNASDDGDYGGCYANLCTLRAALAAATGGGTIDLMTNVSLSSDIEYDPNKTLTIDGGDGATVDGGGLHFDAGTITLKNLSVKHASNSGLAFGGVATLTNVHADNNGGDLGAGINFDGTKLTMNGGEINQNEANDCGALMVDSGSATLTDVVALENSGEYGGAMCVFPEASLTLKGGGLFFNASNHGGGVFDAGTLSVSGTIFVENIGGDAGAAIDAESLDDGIPGGTATITNATFFNNPYSWTIQDESDGRVALVNSTIAGNGGGIGGSGAENVVLLNTLVAGNTDAGDCEGPVTSLGHNLDDDGSCGLAAKGDQSHVDDARIGDPNDFGLPLENGSPALDAGTKTGNSGLTVPAKDAAGTARPQGGGVDIGAMEMGEHKLAITTIGSGTVAPDQPPTTGGWYVAGSTVHLTATPTDEGGALAKWTGACTGTGAGTDVVISGDETCTAVFVDPPTITSFSPSHARIGSMVTITGTHLDRVAAVTFGGTPAVVKWATPTKLGVVVPEGLIAPAPVLLTVTNAAATADSGLQLFTPDWLKPEITSISPSAAKAGTAVTITGKNFLGLIGVTFSGGVDGVLSGKPTDTKIRVIVPAGAQSGPVTVSTPGGTRNSKTFTILRQRAR